MGVKLLIYLLAFILVFSSIQTSFELSEKQAPLKQIKSGTSLIHIQCNDGKYPVYKFDFTSVACVSDKTKSNLVERGWATNQVISFNENARPILCNNYDGNWHEEYKGCTNITDNQCLLMGGFFVTLGDVCQDDMCQDNDSPTCTVNYDFYMHHVEGKQIELEGVIMNVGWGPKPEYSFFTNEPHVIFNTGSSGIRLDGINSQNDMHGKVVKLVGIRADRDMGIKVKEIEVLDSLMPKANSHSTEIMRVTLDELTYNPDPYYNQTISISGQLEEWENALGYAGVGCHTARYATSDKFVPDFPSSRHLYDGDKKMGVRIGTPDDLGQVQELLPAELKNNRVLVEGLFVPNVVEKGSCEHVIHKSGYILTDIEKIRIVE